jgi:hypothetical protein
LTQRAIDGSGCCTVLIQIGTIFTCSCRPPQLERDRHSMIDQDLLAHDG